MRPTIGTLAGVLGFVAVASGCSGRLAAGNAETDRIAKVVSDAISYPYQKSAAGYARALATRARQDGRLRVVAIEELKADELSDPLGRLVFLVHPEGSEAGWTKSPPVTACYKAEFSFYGVVDSPRRMVCPQDATPVTPPPTQPTPEIMIPDGADKVVEQVLTAAAPTSRAEDLRGALAEALGRAAPDAPPGRRPPAPQVVTDGSDIGVALAAPDDHSCLLGARTMARSWCGARAGCRSSRVSSPAPPGPRWPGRGRSPHIDHQTSHAAAALARTRVLDTPRALVKQAEGGCRRNDRFCDTLGSPPPLVQRFRGHGSDDGLVA